MNQCDTYLGLCTEVYDLSKPKPPKDAYEFFRDYVISAQGPVLEPMCGTGRFLLPLLEEGFDVHGFDASDHMLEALNAKARAKNLKPNVWKGCVEDLKRPDKYNLIFIPSGSFGLIVDEESVKKAFTALYDHLHEAGILLLEADTPQAVPSLNIWRGSVYHKANGEMIILSQLAVLEDNVCHSIGKYELISNNCVKHSEVEEYRVRIYDPHDLMGILKSCGFNSIRMIKAFDKAAAIDNNDAALVYECRK